LGANAEKAYHPSFEEKDIILSIGKRKKSLTSENGGKIEES